MKPPDRTATIRGCVVAAFSVEVGDRAMDEHAWQRAPTRAELRDALRDFKDDLKDTINERCNGLSTQIHGTNERLDDLNGRTRKAESEIAVLKDRSDNAEVSAQHKGRNYGALAGGGIAAAIWAAVELLPKLFQRP